MLHKSPVYYHGHIANVHKISIKEKDYRPLQLHRKNNKVVDLVYYFSGCDVTRVGENLYTNTADTIKILPSFQILDEDAAVKSEAPGEVINISFSAEKSFVTETMVIDASQNPKLKHLFIKIHNLWIQKKGNYKFEAVAMFFQIMNEIFNTLSMDAQNSGKSKKLDNALNYIHERYYEKDFSFDILPQLCGLKHTQFNLLFHQIFNTTPVKYVTELRMKLAIDMLISQHHTISEIAEKTGYESVSYFSRVFSKNLGTVPSKYIEKHNTIHQR